MKYFLIAGEASGDLHGSNLIKALQKFDRQAEFNFAGGDLMHQAAGKPPVIHYRNMAFMGLIDVLKNLHIIQKNFKTIRTSIFSYQPDAVILIDYPGFNLKMARWAKQKGFKVFYYISPKLWAWKKGRIEIIRKYVDKMFVILPFEKDYYRQRGVEVEYVGNPVYDAVRAFSPMTRENFIRKHQLSNKPIIALLPGSRKQEIKKMLPVMEEVTMHFQDYQWVIAGAPSLDREIYQTYSNRNIPVIFDDAYNLLHHARAAIVTSGTATLETALLKTPQVVGYKTQQLQYWIGKQIVNIKYFSLVNLILNKPAVPELLQHEFNPQTITLHLSKILSGAERFQMLEDYTQLEKLLENKNASEETARKIVELTRQL